MLKSTRLFISPPLQAELESGGCSTTGCLDSTSPYMIENNVFNAEILKI
jgi:hypothetical protein